MTTRAKPSVREVARLAIAAIATVASVGVATGAHAEVQAQLRIERGPYYVGDQIELHLQATGFERSPEPTCEAAAPPHTTLSLSAVVPTVSSSVRIVGSKISREETVTFTCQYVLVASRAGPVRLAPLVIRQGGVSATSQPHALTVA